MLPICVNFYDQIEVWIKQNSKKNTYFSSADIHLGDKVIKMAVICQWVVIWLQLCANMIAKTLTFHLIPDLSNLKHIQHCYKVRIAKAKFCLRGNLELSSLGFL